jgi:hypothetical protein
VRLQDALVAATAPLLVQVIVPVAVAPGLAVTGNPLNPTVMSVVGAAVAVTVKVSLAHIRLSGEGLQTSTSTVQVFPTTAGAS